MAPFCYNWEWLGHCAVLQLSAVPSELTGGKCSSGSGLWTDDIRILRNRIATTQFHNQSWLKWVVYPMPYTFPSSIPIKCSLWPAPSALNIIVLWKNTCPRSFWRGNDSLSLLYCKQRNSWNCWELSGERVTLCLGLLGVWLVCCHIGYQALNL